jgi:hypothetical protein
VLFAVIMGCGIRPTIGNSSGDDSKVPTPVPLRVVPQTLPSAKAGLLYGISLAAIGGVPSYRWAVLAGILPNGIGLDVSTGLLSGTTNQTGLFPFSAKVTDSKGNSAYISLSLSVLGNVTPPSLTITTGSLQAATQEVAYSASLSAVGGVPPYRWQVSGDTLPIGFGLDAGSGLLSGTTNQVGVFPLYAEVTDAGGAVSYGSLSLTVLSNDVSCGPPKYCARTDLRVQQISSVPFSSPIGANTTAIDPDFNAHLVRITDAMTNPAKSNQSYFGGLGGSEDVPVWSADDGMFFVQDGGANILPFSFNENSMTASRLYVSQFPDTGGIILPRGVWSSLIPALFYEFKGARIYSLDLSDPNTVPLPQLVEDFAADPACGLPSGFQATWQAIGGISHDDSLFAVALSDSGHQGTGTYALFYKMGAGCRMLNTATGVWSGAWGEAGTYSLPQRFDIHNLKLSAGGIFATLQHQRHGCLNGTQCPERPYFLEIGTLSAWNCSNGNDFCGGHWTGVGYNHFVNDSGPGGATPFTIRLFNDPLKYTELLSQDQQPPNHTGVLDSHISWQNDDSLDTKPVFVTSTTSTTPFQTALYNEVYAVATDGSGTIWRFCHTFITGKSQFFSTKNAIGGVSHKGRLFLFSSDMMGGLGCPDGTANCTADQARGDVFVVELIQFHFHRVNRKMNEAAMAMDLRPE